MSALDANSLIVVMLCIAFIIAMVTKRRVYFKARCPCCKKELIVDGECVRRPHLEDQA